jgi:hypothetical protein
MTFSVDITVGSHSWAMLQAEGQVTDGITVLAGLQFGWSVPRDGLWPVQPDPSTAQLALNVPYFNDVADIDEGDKVAIEVKADSAGPVVARFYGNLTNRRATPRPGRLGVTFSIVAVDPTVQVTELPSTAGTDLGSGLVTDNVVPDLSGGTAPFIHAVDLLNYVWLHRLPGGVDLTGLDYTNDDVSMFVPVGSDVRAYIDNLLLQLVNVSDRTRMIFSPYIDSDGDLAAAPSGRYFTLDTIKSGTVVDLIGRPGGDTDPLVFPAAAIARDQLGWNAAKGINPGAVQVTGFGNDPSSGTVQETPYTVGGANAGTASITSQLADGADAINLAIFYANLLWSPWQVDDITLLVSSGDPDVDDLEIPVGLFPDWTLDEGDPGRASCYTQRVTLTALQSSVTPDGTDTATGVLMGAKCRITGGRLYLDLSLRTVPADAPDPETTLRLGAFGEASIGGLATT